MTRSVAEDGRLPTTLGCLGSTFLAACILAIVYTIGSFGHESTVSRLTELDIRASGTHLYTESGARSATCFGTCATYRLHLEGRREHCKTVVSDSTEFWVDPADMSICAPVGHDIEVTSRTVLTFFLSWWGALSLLIPISFFQVWLKKKANFGGAVHIDARSGPWWFVGMAASGAVAAAILWVGYLWVVDPSSLLTTRVSTVARLAKLDVVVPGEQMSGAVGERSSTCSERCVAYEVTRSERKFRCVAEKTTGESFWIDPQDPAVCSPVGSDRSDALLSGVFWFLALVAASVVGGVVLTSRQTRSRH